MSIIKSIKQVLGLSGTASQNHFWDGSAPNRLTLRRGTPDAPGSTVMQVVNGVTTFPTGVVNSNLVASTSALVNSVTPGSGASSTLFVINAVSLKAGQRVVVTVSCEQLHSVGATRASLLLYRDSDQIGQAYFLVPAGAGGAGALGYCRGFYTAPVDEVVSFACNFSSLAAEAMDCLGGLLTVENV